jgi:transposase InsO family protein
MGIRDHPTAPRSRWQNGHAERLIGSIRRECLDHVVVFGEAHPRRIVKAYASYYNEVRTHLALHKDAPELPPRSIGRFCRGAAIAGRSASSIRSGLSSDEAQLLFD